MSKCSYMPKKIVSIGFCWFRSQKWLIVLDKILGIRPLWRAASFLGSWPKLMIVVLAGNYPIARLHYFSACCLQPCSAAAVLPPPCCRRRSATAGPRRLSFFLVCFLFSQCGQPFLNCSLVCLFWPLLRRIKPSILEIYREMWCLPTMINLHVYTIFQLFALKCAFWFAQ